MELSPQNCIKLPTELCFGVVAPHRPPSSLDQPN
jgi:hypothetical protein